jgi:hypothetical protein
MTSAPNPQASGSGMEIMAKDWTHLLCLMEEGCSYTPADKSSSPDWMFIPNQEIFFAVQFKQGQQEITFAMVKEECRKFPFEYLKPEAMDCDSPVETASKTTHTFSKGLFVILGFHWKLDDYMKDDLAMFYKTSTGNLVSRWTNGVENAMPQDVVGHVVIPMKSHMASFLGSEESCTAFGTQASQPATKHFDFCKLIGKMTNNKRKWGQ